MDGVETARVITALGLTPTPHLVMITAYGREEVLQAAESAGFDDVIIKPVNPSILFDSVVRILGGKFEDVRAQDQGAGNYEEKLASIKGASILVAEDNELNQEVAMGLLTEVGFNVTIANNGAETLDFLNKNTYDVVLMDMQMPVMDGVTATQEIRKNPDWKDLPIIAMTANAMTQDRERCLAAGMNDHVAKPIDPEELYRALLQWIKPRASANTSAQTNSTKTQTAARSASGPIAPVIEGVGVQLGLKRVLGKVPAYLSMLGKYLESQPTLPTEFRQALANNDMATAERLAHTAKAVNGNIGATRLQQQAEELEQLCHSGAAHELIETTLTIFEEGLYTLLRNLEAALPAKAEAQAATYDMNLVKPVVQKLVALLAADDSEACDYFAENASVIRSVVESPVFARIEKAIGNFDFEKALAIVKEQAVFSSLTDAANRGAP